MKKSPLNLFVLVLALTLSVSKVAISNIQSEANAECGDSIVFNSGTSVKAKIIETDVYDIKYKRCANLEGPTISVSKTSVALVKYTNGTVESFKDSPKRPHSNLKDSLTMKHRYVGLGIRASGLQVSDLLSNPVPPYRLILNIDPIKYIRIECQYGFYSSKFDQKVTTSTGGTITLVPTQKSTFISGGIMGLYPIGNARFNFGVRYALNKYSDDDVYSTSSWSNPSNPFLVTNTGKRTLISGVIGGEYFFAKFFSVGAEFSFGTIKDVYTMAAVYVSPPTTSKTTMTDGSLIFRFYPF